MLLLGQHEVNSPATTNMGTWTAKVIQKSGARVTGFFQGVGKDRQASRVQRDFWQLTVLIGGCRKSDNRAPVPVKEGRKDCWGSPEEAAENVCPQGPLLTVAVLAHVCTKPSSIASGPLWAC
jgi:hypothetical protein